MVDILNTLDLDESGQVSCTEFKRIFGMGNDGVEEKSRVGTMDRRRKKWKRG